MADLEKLPYTVKFVREALRPYPVVPMVVQQAARDAVIPVRESYKDCYGVVRTEIRMQKWDVVIIPILAMNRAKDVWGEDAMEFRHALHSYTKMSQRLHDIIKPERWDNLPPAVKDMPGVWENLMTFTQGNQSCIAYQFSVIEVKILLYSLVRSIEFSIDPKIEIVGKTEQDFPSLRILD
ncbi:hypothetical protein FRC10_005086 [Ceratobasidium sp. 414]|nr:hypothetical protein FRC10_005086 [Ceratobasidium sp. 414]